MSKGYLEQVANGLDFEAEPPPEPRNRKPVSVADHAKLPPPKRHPRLRGVPILGRTAAGTGVEAVDSGVNSYAYVPPDLATHPDTFAAKVEGNSMAPHVMPGDTVVCNASAREVKGGLYYIQHNGELDDGNRLKLVWPVEDDDELLELRSSNAAYPTVRVKKSSIGRPALVLYVIRPAENIPFYGSNT